MASTTLNARLGHPDDARLVIISCDDLGAFQSANDGVYRALRDGVASCASLMVPAPWARHAVMQYRGEDIGVHLTLNSEHEMYRWGPLTHSPSLLSGEGGFPRSIDDLWEHADTAEVLRECRAQIARAIEWGIDVTHLAPHLTAITLRPEFFDVYLELAVEFRLPIRLPSTISETQAGFPFRRLAAEEGVVVVVNKKAPKAKDAAIRGVCRASRTLCVTSRALRVVSSMTPAEPTGVAALITGVSSGAARRSRSRSWASSWAWYFFQ